MVMIGHLGSANLFLREQESGSLENEVHDATSMAWKDKDNQHRLFSFVCGGSVYEGCVKDKSVHYTLKLCAIIHAHRHWCNWSKKSNFPKWWNKIVELSTSWNKNLRVILLSKETD